jgi:signal transduction histidine kinase/DNA-binding response OmpR family regulator/PAS domain-containing protein
LTQTLYQEPAGADGLAHPNVSAFITSGGEMAALIGSRNWSETPLGPRESWPRSLETALRILVTSRYAMWLGWGPDLIFFYNDAYQSMTRGAKHPWALGQPASKVWEEIWQDLRPRTETVLRTGNATWDEGLLLFLERSGYPEETYHTFSYSPLPDDDGKIGGMLCVVTEDTERVIGERRLATLQKLASELAAVRTEPDVCAAIQRGLATNQHDLPFTLTYLFDPSGDTARLACRTGIAAGHAGAPELLDATALGSVWPAQAILRGASKVVIDDLSFLPALPTGAWDKPPHAAVAVPIVQQGQSRPAGMFVKGINPYRPLDESNAGFIDLVASQIDEAGLASARAYEAERQRAEALAEIDRSKTAFFSNVSQEFRTPLTLMLGPLEEELARRAPNDTGQLAMVQRNGLRLLRLVNTLLDFSRIEAGRVRATYRPTDLAPYTAELASNFRSACERANLALVVDCRKLPQPVYVDADMWERIVLNLVSNARKYTLRGGIHVTLKQSDEMKAAELIVADSGVGIPQQEIPRIFERFHRIEGQRGCTLEGTGIGLALVNELVRLHGGTIAIESSIDIGTTVRVVIPFGHDHLALEHVSSDLGRTIPEGSATAAFVEEALRWLPDAAGNPIHESDVLGASGALASLGTMDAPREIKRHRILVADDNADMRDYVARLLHANYAVQTVSDGEAALRAVQAERPDLLLTDVMMPRLDGFALLSAIRTDPLLRDLPVILVSARAGDEARIDGLEASADDYLVKPFSARELLARVRSNLDMAKVRQQAADQIRAEAHRLEVLNRTGMAIAAELDLDRLVQTVTDAAVELTGAKFWAFFYNATNDAGEAYTVCAVSGAPRDAFAEFPMPRNTAVFEPAFRGTGIVRSDDVRRDPRYRDGAPHYGMPHGHLPVRSYLAAPVVSRSGEVLGGLFFGHPDAAVFTARDEPIVSGIAVQAAVGIDNARLYRASRQAEENLRRLNDTLEQRVADGINERLRTEEALRQAQKMEAVGQFTGGVAHDFNNLLTIISGGVGTLQRHLPPDRLGDNPARVSRALALIEQGAQRAATLTHRLLAFARRQTLAPKPLDANRLVTGMSELLRRTLGESIAIETVLAGGLWRIFADPNQLENALLNLAVNARDAMPGGGKLTIETANAWLDDAYATLNKGAAPGQYVLIAISDTGTGIPKDIIEHVFEPFFTTKDVGHGTGLGLSQVYGFIKQSNGHIKVYSEPGQGTTVKLYLPRLLTGSDDADEVARQADIPRADSAEVVLVVEDDDDVRSHTTDVLRELGYRVLEAANGAAALALLARTPDVHLLFTDVGLPGGMTGRQLVEEVRRRWPSLKVLYTTGYARNAIVHGGVLDPGTELLSKPFTYADLAAKIRSVLES